MTICRFHPLIMINHTSLLQDWYLITICVLTCYSDSFIWLTSRDWSRSLIATGWSAYWAEDSYCTHCLINCLEIYLQPTLPRCTIWYCLSWTSAIATSVLFEINYCNHSGTLVRFVGNAWLIENFLHALKTLLKWCRPMFSFWTISTGGKELGEKGRKHLVSSA